MKRKFIQTAVLFSMAVILCLQCCVAPEEGKVPQQSRYDSFTNDPQISKSNYSKNKSQYPQFFEMGLAGPGLTAWDYSTGKSVNVAVFDGGIDPDDSELKGRVKGFYNAVLKKEGSENIDNERHGTSVAKVLAAAGNNSYANAGVAYQVNLYFVQVGANESQSVYSESVIEGIRYAISKNCRIVSMSLSDTIYDEEMKAAINEAYYRTQNSILFFGSGGNTAQEEYRYPSSYENVMCITGATYSSKTKSYSYLGKGTYHDHMDLAAPGGSTSAATPYAAGTAALVFAVDPSLSAADCEAILKETAKDIGSVGYDKHSGYGLVQPLSAVQRAKYKTNSINRSVNGTASYEKAVNSGSFRLDAKVSGSGVLSYKSGNSKVCTVTSGGKVTVKGIGKTNIKVSVPKSGIFSAASKNISITVRPKRPAIKSAKKTAKKQLTVKWKKDSKVSGYQIQVSDDSDFKTAKTYQVKKSSVSKQISVRKKTCYVRMRSYKKVGKTRIYSTYSKIKTVKM